MTSLEPVAPPPASRRVGHPLPPPGDVSVGRSLVGVGGAVLSLMGVGFVLWNLPAADQLGDVAVTLLMAIVLFLGPGGLLVWLSLRSSPRRRVQMPVPRAVRVAAAAEERAAEIEEEDERTGNRQQATGNRQ